MARIVDVEQKRALIAEKAVEVFAEKGYEKSTIQDIAERAGIAKGSVYQYYKTKQDILIHITGNFLGGYEDLVDSFSLQTENPAAKLKALIRAGFSELDSMEDLMKVYIEIWTVNIRGGYGDMKKIFDAFLDKMRNLLTGIIEEGKMEGIFRKDLDSRAVSVYLIASLDGLGFHYLFNKKSFNLEETIDGFLEGLMGGLLA